MTGSAVRLFAWACVFLTAILAMIAAFGGLVLAPIVYALTIGDPRPLLFVIPGIPVTVAIAFAAFLVCGRLLRGSGMVA